MLFQLVLTFNNRYYSTDCINLMRTEFLSDLTLTHYVLCLNKLFVRRQCLHNAISQHLICMKFLDITWIDDIINSFGKELPNFTIKGSFAPKTDFLSHVSVGVLLSTHKLSFWVKMTMNSYNLRSKDVPLSDVYLYTSYHVGDILRWKYYTFIQHGFIYSFTPWTIQVSCIKALHKTITTNSGIHGCSFALDPIFAASFCINCGHHRDDGNFSIFEYEILCIL